MFLWQSSIAKERLQQIRQEHSHTNPVPAYIMVLCAYDPNAILVAPLKNRTPLAPPGTPIIVHEKPSQRASWAPMVSTASMLALLCTTTGATAPTSPKAHECQTQLNSYPASTTFHISPPEKSHSPPPRNLLMHFNNQRPPSMPPSIPIHRYNTRSQPHLIHHSSYQTKNWTAGAGQARLAKVVEEPTMMPMIFQPIVDNHVIDELQAKF